MKEKQIQRCFLTIDNGLGAYVHNSGSVWKQKNVFSFTSNNDPSTFFSYSVIFASKFRYIKKLLQ